MLDWRSNGLMVGIGLFCFSVREYALVRGIARLGRSVKDLKLEGLEYWGGRPSLRNPVLDQVLPLIASKLDSWCPPASAIQGEFSKLEIAHSCTWRPPQLLKTCVSAVQ